MTRKLFLIFALISLALCAQAGTLVTRDGKTYAGRLQLSETKITIATEAGEKSFAFSEISQSGF